MNQKQYLAVQLQLVNIARQMKAIDGLDDFLATANRAAEHEKDGPVDDPDFIQAREGLRLIRELAEIVVTVKKKCSEFDAYMHRTRSGHR